MPRIFISHCSKDYAVVLQIANRLKDCGADVWHCDWDISVGDDIRRQLEEGIATCEYFLIALSPDAVASRWVQHELTAALINHIENDKTKILPVKLVECQIPLLIAGKKYANMTRGFEAGMSELLKAIGTVNCVEKSSELSTVFLARRGEGGTKSSRIAYASLGVPGIIFHWIVESVGDRPVAVEMTATSHQILFDLAKAMLSNKPLADIMSTQNPSFFLESVFSLLNAAVRVDLRGRTSAGSKCTLAIQQSRGVYCANIGVCGGFVRWDEPGRVMYQRIETPSRFQSTVGTGDYSWIISEAPLGHIDKDQIVSRSFFFPVTGPNDWFALTSFGTPIGDEHIRKLIDAVSAAECVSKCAVASQLCEVKTPIGADCLCALVGPLRSLRP